jgi:hypothetical protein
MELFVSPQQQAIVTGELGTAQDATHDAYAAIAADERTHFIAAGSMYRIGPDPALGQHFGLGMGGRGYLVIWPDGTEQRTRNLWHWGDTDRPDSAVLMQEPFWGNNLRIDDRELLLQPPPHHLRAIYDAHFPYGFYGILDDREAWQITAARKQAEWNARYDFDPILRLLRYRMGGWRHRVLAKKFARAVRGFINAHIICLKCRHRPSTHWHAEDEYGGDIDWGCGHSHRDPKSGKLIHCRC